MTELAVVLPTYNEVENLPGLIRDLQSLGLDLQVLVVDGNSQDGTQRAAQELCHNYRNVRLINGPQKVGLGSALRHGLSEALATGATYLATMDADGSHHPQDLPRLLQEIRAVDRQPPIGLVQGSRFVAGGGIKDMGLVREVSSRVVNLLYRWCTGGPHETTTNFRVFSRPAASLVVSRAKGWHFEFVPEASLLVRASGLRVVEVPILFTGRLRGRSKLGAKQAVRGLVYLLVTCFLFRLRLGRFSRRPYPGAAAKQSIH